MKVHDLKDITKIYHDCDDYQVKVWDPVNQKNYDLIFTGSSNPDKSIHFNISEVAMSDKERERIDTLNELIRLNRDKSMIEDRIQELKNKIDF